ncbi:MAG: PspC domain-containing protein [Flavobacteriales bacterium]|nr:PspC domain-containing protein [Flavobacteriales bacterium]
MKKTLTVNVSGTVFHIEEDAYEALHRYLANIRGRFEGSAGRDEIMADIESRIAELFTERLDGRGEVVTLADVEHVIAVMGQPEDYAGGEGSGSGEARGRRYKRLFRDPDDEWIGGVLGGIAAYIGMDPLWLRIAFIVLILLGVGSPILLYILLWILIPKASTAADRLMMDGEPVTVDNLKRTFEEGAQRVASDVEDLGRKWSGEEGKRRTAGLRRRARDAGDGIAVVIRRVIGLVLLAVGVGLAVTLLSAAVGGGIAGMGSGIGLYELGGLVFPTSSLALWFAISVFLLALIPIIGVLSAGLQLLLDVSAPRWFGWTLVPIWIVALVVTIVIGVRLGSDFQRTEMLRTEIAIEQPAGDVLFLEASDEPGAFRGPWNKRHKRIHIDTDWQGLDLEGDSIRGAWGRLDVRRSPDEHYHLLVERRTQGRNAKASLRRSENITCQVERSGDVLTLSPWLTWPKQDKIRGQRIRFVLQVPEGKSVHFHTDIAFMLDNVRNTSNTLDRDMVDRTWTMTAKGLSSEGIAPKAEEPVSEPGPAEKEVVSLSARPVLRPVWNMPDLFALMRPGQVLRSAI